MDVTRAGGCTGRQGGCRDESGEDGQEAHDVENTAEPVTLRTADGCAALAGAARDADGTTRRQMLKSVRRMS